MSLYPFGVILIIVGACDGAIGLGLLIRYVRGAGNDFYQSFFIFEALKVSIIL